MNHLLKNIDYFMNFISIFSKIKKIHNGNLYLME